MPPKVVATAYLHAINYILFGKNVAGKWITAVQNASALKKAYRKGYYEAMQRQAEAMNEMANSIFGKMTEEERTLAWMYMIFNKDKIIEKTEEWTKEAEKAGMTLTEYLESISPLKTVTNAKDAENYPISEDISKGIEEINKLIFENGHTESEDKNETDS